MNGRALLPESAPLPSRDLARGEEAVGTVDREARAIQLDLTDDASIVQAAAQIRTELGRLDILIQNAAISNTGKKPGQTVEVYARTVRASVLDIGEMRAIGRPTSLAC